MAGRSGPDMDVDPHVPGVSCPGHSAGPSAAGRTLAAVDDAVVDAMRLQRVGNLHRRLADLDRVLVAFSGGADSAFLLTAAARTIGAADVIAATAVSPSLPVTELAYAREFADNLGVWHLTPHTDELSRDGYRANGGDRCYFCKAELLDTLAPIAAELGAVVLTGTNADDAVAGFRPGIRAAQERGAQAPLRDAGLTKQQIRDTSREWGLRTWDKPAAACLSSRIAYGLQISSERLARVEAAEATVRLALTAIGHQVSDLRVRDMGGGAARIEISPQLVGVLRSQPVPLDGYDAVDVREFRSGSMNDALAPFPVGSAAKKD